MEILKKWRLALVAAMLIAGTQAAIAQTSLRFVTVVPGKNAVNAAFTQWAEKVNEDLGGNVNIDVIVGNALGVHGQILDRVNHGVIDLGFELLSYHPGQFTRTDVSSLPGMYENAAVGSIALWDLYASGALDDEFKDIVVLALWVFPNADLLTVDPVTAENPVSGRKFSTNSALRSEIAEKLGATPLSLKISEWYQAIQRGLIGGLVQSTSAVAPYSLQEVVHHVVRYPFGGNAGALIMSKAKFDALTPEEQAAIMDNSGRDFSLRMGQVMEGLSGFGRKLITDAGGDARLATSEEAAIFGDVARDVRENWIKANLQHADVVEAFAGFVEADKDVPIQ